MDKVTQQTPTPPIPQTPDQMHSSVENSNGSKIIPIIITAIILIIVGVGSYVLGTNKNKVSTNSSTQALQCKIDVDCSDNNVCTDDICAKGVCSHPNSIQGKSCGATLPGQGQTQFCNGSGKCVYSGPIQPGPLKTDETANWKTYTNTVFNFSIKYPQKWIANAGNVTYFSDEKGEKIPTQTIILKDNSDSTTISIMGNFQAGWGYGTTWEEATLTSSSKVKVTKYTSSGSETIYYRIALPIDSLFITSAPATQENLIDQILSTFQFSN
jgi:hypothetical protein